MAKGSDARRAALDTSCVVALLCGWHERHVAVSEAIGEALRSGATLIVPAHALVEAYAVLTRLPPPHRMSPADAHQLLAQNFRAGVAAPALGGRETWRTIDEAASAGVAGGRTYDAMIAAAARRARATVFYTLNPRHFVELERGGVALPAL